MPSGIALQPASTSDSAAERRRRRSRTRTAAAPRTRPTGAAHARRARSGESSPERSRSGIASAVTTPASVACTPDFSTQTQITRPTTTYGADAASTRSAVQQQQHGRARAGRDQHRQRQVVGVEQRDHDDRAEVVDDRDRRQEDLQRRRHARAEQQQDAERERDVGRRRDRPAAQRDRVAAVDRSVDRRRHQHAAERRDRGQHGLARASPARPRRSSRLISSPTTKKNTAIQRSLIHSSSGFDSTSQPSPMRSSPRQFDERPVERGRAASC